MSPNHDLMGIPLESWYANAWITNAEASLGEDSALTREFMLLMLSMLLMLTRESTEEEQHPEML